MTGLFVWGDVSRCRKAALFFVQALMVAGRIFIREGMLWKVCRKGPKKRQFFLFNDILVSTSCFITVVMFL